MNNPDFVEQENLQEKSQQRISLKAFSRLFIVVLILIATGFGLKYYLENPGVINTAPEDEKPVVEYQGLTCSPNNTQ